jgi:transcriptional regulator with XRE-family HTH domain
MINANLIRAKIVENGMKQAEVAAAMGISSKTFSLKMSSGKFGLDEAEKMIRILKIENPERYFFAKEGN